MTTLNTTDLPTLLIVFGSAVALSLVLTPLFRHLAVGWNLVDCPDGRRKHQKAPIPLAGGLAVITTCILTLGLLFFFPTALAESLITDPRALPLLAAVLLLGIVGLADDAMNLRGRHKLIGQLVAIGILVTGGEIRIEQVEVLGWQFHLGALGSIFSALWLLGCINAINLLDGMDGLLGSLGVIVCVTVAIIAGMSGQLFVVLVALALAGALIGFLCYNLPPATVYLGDCGSMFIGLVVGTLSLVSSTKGQAVSALAVPFALLVLPFFDTFAAITRRKLTGRSIYTTDRGHLHHCLQRRLTRPTILFLVMGLGLFASIGAIATTIWRNDAYALVACIMVIASLVLTRLFGHAEVNLIKDKLIASFPAFRKGNSSRQRREMEVQLQGNANWNLVWDQLSRGAERLNLRSICLDVNAPAYHENYHARWDRFDVAADDPTQWKAELPLMLHGQVIGRLSAVGVLESRSIGSKLTALIDLLEHAEQRAHQVTAHHPTPPGVPVVQVVQAGSNPELDLVGLRS